MDIVFYVNRAADQLLAKIDKVPFRRKTVERDLDQVTKRRLSRAASRERELCVSELSLRQLVVELSVNFSLPSFSQRLANSQKFLCRPIFAEFY